MDAVPRKSYPSDVSDDEWAFVAPYLTLMRPDAPQRVHDPREVYNALRWMVRTGAQWRMLPNDLPPWEAVYQQARRWLDAGCFADMVHDLRAMLRWSEGRADDPTAVVLDSRTVQSTPESGARGGYDGHKRRKGSKVHLAVDIGIEIDTHAEADRIFAALSEGANVEYPFQEMFDGNYFGSLVDKFGTQWLVSCPGPS